jgi:hypothetical protein
MLLDLFISAVARASFVWGVEEGPRFAEWLVQTDGASFDLPMPLPLPLRLPTLFVVREDL